MKKIVLFALLGGLVFGADTKTPKLKIQVTHTATRQALSANKAVADSRAPILSPALFRPLLTVQVNGDIYTYTLKNDYTAKQSIDMVVFESGSFVGITTSNSWASSPVGVSKVKIGLAPGEELVFTGLAVEGTAPQQVLVHLSTFLPPQNGKLVKNDVVLSVLGPQ